MSKPTLTQQVEALIMWASSEAKRLRRRHFVYAVKHANGWYYEAQKYPDPIGRTRT